MTTIATPDDALTITLEVTDLMLEYLEDDTARDRYLAIRELINNREIGSDTREGMIISNIMDLADDHFDL